MMKQTKGKILPTIGYKPDMFNLTVQKAIEQLIPFARQSQNPLVEAGVLYIKKIQEKEYLGSVTFFEYEDEQDMEVGRPSEVEYDLPITF